VICSNAVISAAKNGETNLGIQPAKTTDWWFGTKEWIMTFQKQLGMSSSQLTNSFIFFRGVGQPPTRYALTIFNQHKDGDFM